MAGPAALAVLLLWVLGFRSSASARSADNDAPPAEPATSPAGFAASSLGPAAMANLSRAARESAARETARIVAEKNAESAKDRRAFAADGWEKVDAPPPDAKLLAYDPELLNGREEELRTQIASTVAKPADADRLAEVARRAEEPRTRTAAVEALGRVGGPEAQRALFGLLTKGNLDPEDPARRAIAPLLRPTELSDTYAAQLAAQLDAPGLTPAERKQIAFTLALVGLRDGTELPRETQTSLSPASRALYAAMVALATQKNPAQEP